MKKNVLLLLLGSCLIFGMFSCRKTVKKAPELAVLLPGAVECFSIEKIGMDKAAAQFGLKLIYADAEWDAGKQLSQVENFVTRQVDMILLCAGDNRALLPAVDICKEADIPLITFTNTLGPNPDGTYEGIVSYIGTNEINVGRQLGAMAEKLIGDKPANIVLLEGEPGTAPQRLRSRGFKEVVQMHPDWNIIYSQAIPGWTKEGALAAMEAFLQTGQKVDLVTCHWWGAASAASIALNEFGYQEPVYVTGLEFAKDLIDYMKEGKIHMTTHYSFEECGYTVVEAAHKYLTGESIPAFIEITPFIVDRTNVDRVVPEL